MPIKNDREYRNIVMPFAAKETERRLDTAFYVEGYATTFTQPYVLYEYEGRKYYEAISRDALVGADVSDVIMQYDHSGRVLARMSNGTLGITPDDHGLMIYADLSKSDAAKSIYEDIASGLIRSMSWAFTVADDEYNQETRTRLIKRIKKVYDVSAVSIPANDATEISARSFVDGAIEKELQELQRLEVAKRKYFYQGGVR